MWMSGVALFEFQSLKSVPQPTCLRKWLSSLKSQSLKSVWTSRHQSVFKDFVILIGSIFWRKSTFHPMTKTNHLREKGYIQHQKSNICMCVLCQEKLEWQELILTNVPITAIGANLRLGHLGQPFFFWRKSIFFFYSWMLPCWRGNVPINEIIPITEIGPKCI